MQNTETQKLIDECLEELQSINHLLTALGPAANPNPYLKKYAIIRACGSVETSFKKLIADRVDRDAHVQLKRFIERRIRQSSHNPKIDKIKSILSEFDIQWQRRFNELLSFENPQSLIKSLETLVNARNTFAHGGHAILEITETIECFNNSVKILKILDKVLHEEKEEQETITESVSHEIEVIMRENSYMGNI